jgi:hypothetical protein
MRPGWVIAAGLAAVAGCHGPPLVEYTPDGGGGTGATGNAGASGTAGMTGRGGRGGTTGAAGTSGRGGGTGTAGAGCAAQMTPENFYRGGMPPVYTAVTATRFYWAEWDTPSITIHYTNATTPVEVPHPLAIGSSGVGHYDITASDNYVVATWGLDGVIAAWGPDMDSKQVAKMTLTYPSAVAIDGPTIFYSYQPAAGTTGTWGIYTWDPNGAPVLFESYTEFQGDRTLGLILRVTPTKLLMGDTTDVWFVDRATKGAKQRLFDNPTTNGILEIRPARPHAAEGPVVVTIDDPILLSGRDYYVNLSQPSAAPKDLGAAVTTLANSSACGNAAVFDGTGVIYQQHYIYQGNDGLFMVDISATGTVSNLVRLTDVTFSYPDVTDAGDIFAGVSYLVSKWDYYRIGKL